MTDTPVVAPPQDSTVHPPARRGNPWHPTLRGVALMTSIELRRRRPSTKGYILYGILFAAVIGICILAAVLSTSDLSSTNLELVLIMVLGVGMLIAPSLSATSINGDSGEGVLAPLQMSHLTAGDIAFGKLIASWLVSVIALLALSPFLVYAFTKSGWHLDELAITLGAILFMVLAFTAVGLAWSSIAARAVASVSLAHLTTGFFAVGTLVLFAVAGTLVTDTKTVTEYYIDWGALSAEEEDALDEAYMSGDFSELDPADYQCIENEWTTGVTHTDRIAWLLLANPVVTIGETAPIVDPETWREDGRAQPGVFAQMHSMVSSARLGPQDDEIDYEPYNECEQLFGTTASDASDEELTPEEQEAQWEADQAEWDAYQQELANLPRAPWLGLAVQAVLLAGSMLIVVRRLRVPYKKLRSGTRVA
ncbi:ABC transporter permease [Demequina sp. NBRC 110051]|uniref:ABC transporter permease n=1 Tax=Demequina sp. NBRC 110051 TaxID=1570340 RepID=UPI000A02CC19|nr:ABC transporter permease [Demequina sp. NBRC 110051]